MSKHGDPTERQAMDHIAKSDEATYRRLTRARKLIDQCMEDLRRR